MEPERRRWRIRISTLMLLVIIAALTAALVVERRKTVHLERELATANARLPRYTTYPAATKAWTAGYQPISKMSR
jgi:lipopolysaccharide export system protein LptC